MSQHAASIVHLLPRPRRVRYEPGVYRLRAGTAILLAPCDDEHLLAAAKLISAGRVAAKSLSQNCGTGVSPVFHHRPEACATRGFGIVAKAAPPGAIALERVSGGRGDQWYSLRIRPDGIRLRAAGAAGFRYGARTLGQLIASGRGAIRAMDIEDWPDFAVRGVMLDISRDKVPTLTTLKNLIDLLAGWKINQLQLYMEHTFAYAGHERVWRGASPLTAPQIHALDAFCRQRGVELVPNQNSFGHMERWLKHAHYRALAETCEPWQTPWGEWRDTPSTLNPLHPGSIRLVSSLYDRLLPHFSSKLLNVGCDETWELGAGASRLACQRRGLGRVYLDFLLKIHRAVKSRGRRMMYWADVVHQHPQLFQELPPDAIPLVWGYEANHPFGRQCAPLAAGGLSFYVCPGTSSWCSFGGRTRNALANLLNAARAGRRYNAAGYLITDWGDCGHRQYLPASYCAFLYGAAVSWCERANGAIDVARETGRHAFGDPSGRAGRLWYDAGAVHEASGVALNNRTILFACMHAPLGDPAGVEGLAPGRAERMERHVRRLAAEAKRARFPSADGDLIREELLATLAVLRHACRRAAVSVARRAGRRIKRPHKLLAADMRRILLRHRALWLARNRRGGLASSVGYYRRNLQEYLTDK